MATFTLPIPSIRFGEFDLGGVLYHANYFHVYEQVREAFLALGPTSYAQLVSEGCHLAITDSHQKFLKPIRYGHAFSVQLWVENLRRASFDFCYSFVSDTELHTGRTSMVFVQTKSGQLCVSPLPEQLAAYLKDFLKSPS